MQTQAILILCMVTRPSQPPRSPTDTLPLSVVKRAEAAFWDHNLGKLMSFYTADAEGYVLAAGDSAGKGPMKKDQIETEIGQFFKEYPHHHSKLLSTMIAGPYVAREYADDAGVPHKRKHLYVFEVRGGKIRRYWYAPVS
jgi:hypothetical protein